MSEYSDFLIDPVIALERKFRKGKTSWCGAERIFIHRGFVGLDGVRYGSYNYVLRDDLLGRKFEITMVDYGIGLIFLDCLHHPRLYKSVPIPYNMGDTEDEVIAWVKSEHGKSILNDRGFQKFTKNNTFTNILAIRGEE